MFRPCLVSLDLTGTLYRFARPPFETYALFALENGISLAPERVQKSFYKSYKEAKTSLPNFGHGSLPSSKEWWSKVVVSTLQSSLSEGITSLDPRLAQKTAHDLYDFYRRPEAYHLYRDVQDFLQNLKSLSVQTCVISNSDARIHSILEGLGIREFFDFILSSEEVGFMKPDRWIFEEALRRARGQFPDSSCLHIGDDLKKDYFAPRQDPRWISRLINRDGSHISPGIINEKEVISSLNDLFKNTII